MFFPDEDDMAIHKIIIAIDGYSSCGKSTTAKLVAAKLGYGYIDTGAMYRAVTLYFLENNIAFTNPKEIEKALHNITISFHHNPKTDENETFLNGVNVEKEIRKMYVSNQVSEVSTIAEVRHAMVAQQQRMGKRKGIVMDGRDIGTHVFPNAELKIFMTADPAVRPVCRHVCGRVARPGGVQRRLAHTLDHHGDRRLGTAGQSPPPPHFENLTEPLRSRSPLACPNSPGR